MFFAAFSCLFLGSDKTAMAFGIFFSVLTVFLVAVGMHALQQARINVAKFKKATEDFYDGVEGMEMPLMGRQRAEVDDEQ